MYVCESLCGLCLVSKSNPTKTASRQKYKNSSSSDVRWIIFQIACGSARMFWCGSTDTDNGQLRSCNAQPFLESVKQRENTESVSGTGTQFGVETGSSNKNPRKIVFIKMIKARLCMLCDKHGVSDWDIPRDVSLLFTLFDDVTTI